MLPTTPTAVDLATAQQAIREAIAILDAIRGDSHTLFYDMGRALGTLKLGLRVSGDTAPLNRIG